MHKRTLWILDRWPNCQEQASLGASGAVAKLLTCNADDMDAMSNAMHVVALDYLVHKAIAQIVVYDVVAPHVSPRERHDGGEAERGTAVFETCGRGPWCKLQPLVNNFCCWNDAISRSLFTFFCCDFHLQRWDARAWWLAGRRMHGA